MNEVLLQMRNVFQKNDLMPQGDVVEQHEMLMDLAHIPDMRDDRQPGLARQQTDGNEFADAADARAIDLDKVGGFELDVVLEDDPIGDMLSDRQSQRSDLTCQLLVPDDVVGMGRLFDPDEARWRGAPRTRDRAQLASPRTYSPSRWWTSRASSLDRQHDLAS